MSARPAFRSRDGGWLAIAAIVLLTALMALGTALHASSFSAMKGAGLAEAGAKAQALADAGLEAALARLPSGGGNLDAPPTALGDGTYEFQVRPAGGGPFTIRATGIIPLPHGRSVRRTVETEAKVEEGKAVLSSYAVAP